MTEKIKRNTHTHIDIKIHTKSNRIGKMDTYFLYRGDLPDMSDKNMVTLQKKKKRNIQIRKTTDR